MPNDRHLEHYLKLLGLGPGASAEDVATAYFVARKALMQTATPEAEARVAEVDHAFRILKARYRNRRRERIHRHVNRFLITAVTVLGLLAVYSGFQIAGRLRPYFADFDDGEILYRYDDESEFGEVLGFEENHEFPMGVRQDAYQIRLHPSGTVAWIAAPTVRKALHGQ